MFIKSALVMASGLVIASGSLAGAQPGMQEPVETEAPPPPTHTMKRIVDPVATDRMFGGGLRLTGLSGVGALPGVNVGGEIAVFVRWEERFVELGLGMWRPQEAVVVSNDVNLGLDVWTVRGGWASKKMPLRAWLMLEAGELAGPHGMMPTGVPRMVMGSVEPEHRWFAAGGGFGVAWPMSDRARLVGNVELAIPIDRTPMMLESGREFEPESATARCSLGLEVGFR